MHTQTGSIIKYLKERHKINKVPRRDFLESTAVLTLNKDKRKLVMIETLLITEKRPSSNSQANFLRKFILKISLVQTLINSSFLGSSRSTTIKNDYISV